MPTIEQTIAFIQRAHAGQKDKAGLEYYLHPVDVMNRLPTEAPLETKLAALLHDILEDTRYTRADLESMGYSATTLDAVELVTNAGDGRDYIDKIRSIILSGNRNAILVKLADVSANSDPSRLALLHESLQLKLRTKYSEPLRLLAAAGAALEK